jgi:hypothetical protein
MEQGLAMMYGSGEGNTVTSSYGGTIDRPKPKGKKKVACKKNKPKDK